jgi:polar amino acid transport system permease protein
MIPQVLTYSTPGLGSEYALLIKDSAYAWVIAVPEVMERAVNLSNIDANVVTPFLITLVIYIAITFPIAQFLDRWGNKRKKAIGL